MSIHQTYEVVKFACPNTNLFGRIRLESEFSYTDDRSAYTDSLIISSVKISTFESRNAFIGKL